MPKQPLVSIIIPTFNRAHLIGETLDSVLAQTYTNWECIVVDDGSTDETEALLEHYIEKDSRFQFHKRPDAHLPGGNGARNYGFNLSKGVYIQWFDSDDLMMPNKIELSVYQIQNIKKDLVISNFHFIGKQPKKRILEFDNLLIFHITNGPINTPMCFFDKNILKDYSFDETLVRGQEFDFFMRLFGNKTIDYSILQESLSEIREHDDSISGKYMKGNESAISSLLSAKLTAYNFSLNFNEEIQKVVSGHFEKTLWKALIFRHKKVYWKYLNLYANQNKSMGLIRYLKLRLLALLFFTFNRGGQFIKLQFFS